VPTAGGEVPTAGTPPMPVPVLPGGGTTVGTRNGTEPAPVPAAAAAPFPAGEQSGSGSLVAAGVALLAAGTGLAAVLGRRGRRAGAPPSPGGA
jgi:hypothetical protein